MNPIEFVEQTVIMGANQPEYSPLPTHLNRNDPEGRLTFCWRFTWRERLKLLWTGKLWHQVLTFGSPLQPQLLILEKPYLKLQMPDPPNPPTVTTAIVTKKPGAAGNFDAIVSSAKAQGGPTGAPNGSTGEKAAPRGAGS